LECLSYYSISIGPTLKLTFLPYTTLFRSPGRRSRPAARTSAPTGCRRRRRAPGGSARPGVPALQVRCRAGRPGRGADGAAPASHRSVLTSVRRRVAGLPRSSPSTSELDLCSVHRLGGGALVQQDFLHRSVAGFSPADGRGRQRLQPAVLLCVVEEGGQEGVLGLGQEVAVG